MASQPLIDVTLGRVVALAAIVGVIYSASSSVGRIEQDLKDLRQDVADMKTDVKAVKTKVGVAEVMPAVLRDQPTITAEATPAAPIDAPMLTSVAQPWQAKYISDHCRHCPACCVPRKTWP